MSRTLDAPGFAFRGPRVTLTVQATGRCEKRVGGSCAGGWLRGRGAGIGAGEIPRR
jgi:hypothetical protein